MTEQLLRAIQGVQRNITENRKYLLQNERQTIRLLIEPVLRALDWRIDDLAQVRFEYPVGNRFVDIALMRNGKPYALLEAKALGKSLGTPEIMQLSDYCNFCDFFNFPTAILTNGAEWQVYHQWLANRPFKKQQLFQVRLGEDEATAAEAAQQLSLLAYNSIDQLDENVQPILLEKYWREKGREELLQDSVLKMRKSFAEWLGKQTRDVPDSAVRKLLKKKLILETPPALPRPAVTLSQTTSATPLIQQQELGRAIVLNGEHIPIKRSNEVLIQTAEWLVARGKLRSQNCPIPFGRGERYLVHIQAQHHNGNRFFSPKTLSNGLFLEAHGSTSGMIKCAFDLLKHCGYTPPEDTLKFSGFDD